MTRLRGALLGAGNIALSGHAPQWSRPEVAAEAEIVAVADLSEANRAAAQRLFPAARSYASAEDLLARERLDFCDVCTPPGTHARLVTLAVEHGLHVLCEKPLAATLPEAEALAARVRASAVVFRMCHQYHHAPMWRAAALYLPAIGRIHLAEYDVHRLSANPGNGNWSPAWRTSAALAGGGVIVDHGAHVFYLLREAMGEARKVNATVRTLRHREYEVDDTACVLLDHGDALARVTLTWAARRREIRFRFVGEHGEVTGDETAVRLSGPHGEEVTPLQGLSEGSSHSDWFAPLFAGFVRGVRARDLSRADLDEAVYVARVIGAAYESSRQGHVIPLTTAVPARRPVPTGIAAPAPVRATGSDLGMPRRAVFRTTTALLLVACAIWMGHDVAWHDVFANAAGAQASWIALAILVNMAGVLVLQAARWLALVRPLSPTATLAKAWRAMIVGFTVSSFVPARGGELARVEWFGRETGLPRMAILGSVLLDHLVDAAALLLGMALLPMFLHVPLWMRPGGWMVATFFAIGVLFILLLRPISERAAARRDSRLVRAVAAWIARLRDGLHATRNPRALMWSFGASAAAWGLEANVATLSLRAVGLHLDIGSVLLVLLAVNLALALPVATPANLGTLEIGATVTLVGMGVAKERALAFALWYHFLQIIPIVAVGLFLVGQAWLLARRAPAAAAAW